MAAWSISNARTATNAPKWPHDHNVTENVHQMLASVMGYHKEQPPKQPYNAVATCSWMPVSVHSIQEHESDAEESI